MFDIFVSLQHNIWDVKFGFVKMSWECEFRSQVFDDWMTTNFVWYVLNKMIVDCIAHLFKIDTFFPSTIRSIWKKLLNNGTNKYKCFFNTKI